MLISLGEQGRRRNPTLGGADPPGGAAPTVRDIIYKINLLDF